MYSYYIICIYMYSYIILVYYHYFYVYTEVTKPEKDLENNATTLNGM